MKTTGLLDVIGMDRLEVGQCLDVQGVARGDGSFLGIDLRIQPSRSDAVLVGVVESVDSKAQTLRLHARELPLSGVKLFDESRRPLRFAEIHPGALVKITGSFSPESGFVPSKIKIKQAQEFNIDKLKGRIDEIDRDRGILRMLGVDVHITERATITSFDEHD